MSVMDQNSGMVMPVTPMGGYGNGMGYSGGDWLFWLLILFLFAFVGNGFGGNTPGNVQNDVQRGFDQNAIITGINGLNTGMNAGFAAAEASSSARQLAYMQQFNALSMALQNYCCENRSAIADVKYAIANDGAATRSAVADAKQGILDKLCQLEMDGIKQNYENQLRTMQSTIDSLRGQLSDARFDASQGAQTAAIQAGQRALANEVEQYVVPSPKPAWIVPNPNCCQNDNFGG